MFIIGYKNVRHYRHTVHLYLDAIWMISSKRRKARSSMYSWLGKQMGLSEEETHVAKFTRAQCQQAIKILRPKYIQLFGHDLEYKKKGKSNMNLVRVTRHEEFEVAHLLPGHERGCGRLHGHTYKIEVTLEGPQVEPWGMIIDFNDLKAAIKEIVPDHKFVYYEKDGVSLEIAAVLKKHNIDCQVYPFMTTAENMVTYFAEVIDEYIKRELGYKDVNVVEVNLWETTNSHATWRK